MKLDQHFFQTGLLTAEAKEKLKKVGPNELAHKKEYSLLKIFLAQFTSPLVYVLFFAGLVTVFMREYLDAGVILMIVILNTALGFYQEKKAAKALDSLKSFLKPKAMVIRDGEKKVIPLSEVVSGDICLVSAGQSIPADSLVVMAEGLKVSESILTGESRPVKKLVYDQEITNLSDLKMADPQSKQAENFVYMGTTVMSGVGRVLVLRTGIKTEIGKIATTLVTMDEKPTPLQVKLANLSKVLSIMVAIGSLTVLGFGLWRGEHFLEMLETAVAIAVSAIPEGLVVSLTVVLSLGMQKIFKHKALVRKLISAETLGSVTVICCDKTGTLTEGVLTVTEAIGNKEIMVKAAVMANDEVDEVGDALMSWAKDELKKGDLWTKLSSVDKLKAQCKKIETIPFSSENKYAASLIERKKEFHALIVGAPELILAKSSLSKDDKNKELKRIEELGKQGYRMVAVGHRVFSKKIALAEVKTFDWQGLFGFEDKVRPGVKEALQLVKKASVGVKVITGDYAETAATVLKKLGFTDEELSAKHIMTGEELKKLSLKELKEKLPEILLFARTSPDQKLKIVEALQAMDEVVAMTGDGVNDSPALKAAEIGVVVNEASDVSKETADMVLLDSNFRSIVLAIKEGRVIIETMKKVVTYLLTDVFASLIVFGGSLIMGWPLPITAIQVLWINLIEDGLPGVSLAFEESDDDVMNDKPRRQEDSIFDPEMKALISIIGMIDLLTLGVYYFLQRIEMPFPEIRTIIFVIMATDSLLYLFSVKSLRKNIWQENLWGNKFMNISVLSSFIGIFLSVYWSPLQHLLDTVSLPALIMVAIIMFSFVQLGLVELIKWWFIEKRREELANKSAN